VVAHPLRPRHQPRVDLGRGCRGGTPETLGKWHEAVGRGGVQAPAVPVGAGSATLPQDGDRVVAFLKFVGLNVRMLFLKIFKKSPAYMPTGGAS
jgi:hypothetical protein